MIEKPDDQSAWFTWLDAGNASPEETAAARANLEDTVRAWTTEQAATRGAVHRIFKELEPKLAPQVQKMFEAGGHDYEEMKKQSEEYFALVEKGVKKDSSLSPEAFAHWEQNVLSAAENDIVAARKAIAHALTSGRTATLNWPGLLVFEHHEGSDEEGTVEIEQGDKEGTK